MRTIICFLIPSLLILSACKKDDFQYSFETPSKLLVSIKENGQLITELKYDSLNRLIQVDRYLNANPGYISQFFSYDSQNRLITKSYSEFTETYEYNGNGRLVAIILHFKSAGDGYEWEQKTELQYSNGKISKGIIYSPDGIESGYFYYKYDSRGNTIERTGYSVLPEYKDIIMSNFKYTYDDKINPYPFSSSSLWGVYQVDIIQGNNPTYFYYYNIVMSSLPPEYASTYDYDNTGLPIKEYREHLNGTGGSNVFDYEYIEKHE
jgi:YD repeat-containing protein